MISIVKTTKDRKIITSLSSAHISPRTLSLKSFVALESFN
jgi:hypothetical protein